MDTQEFFNQHDPQNSGEHKLLAFLPVQFTLLDNHLTGSDNRSLNLQMNTGSSLTFRAKKETGVTVRFLKTNQQFTLEDTDLDDSFRRAAKKAKELTGTKPGFELNYFSDNPLHSADQPCWRQLNQQFLNTTELPEIPDKKLLLKGNGQETTIPLPDNSGYSLVFVDLNCSVPDLKILLEQRNQELNEVLETINQFFELPSLADLSGADQDWLDKVIDNHRLKSRLRHVVNQNTAIEVAANLIQSGKIEALGNLLDDVHESILLDFELTCNKAEQVLSDARNSGIILGSCPLLHNDSMGSLFLIKTEDQDAFHEWLRKTCPEGAPPAVTILFD